MTLTVRTMGDAASEAVQAASVLLRGAAGVGLLGGKRPPLEDRRCRRAVSGQVARTRFAGAPPRFVTLRRLRAGLGRTFCNIDGDHVGDTCLG